MLLCFFRLFQYIVPVDEHFTLGGAEISRHDVHRRGFSGSVRTQKAIDPSGFQSEVQMVYGQMVSVFLHQIPYFYQSSALPNVFFTFYRVSDLCESFVL